MTNIAIRADNLSKLYRIGHIQPRYATLRDTVVEAFKGIYAPSRKKSKEQDSIWALKDVSFEIKFGEVVGIVGRNGAGKSTLLKVLSRITEPTSGEALINGRVGSLLEVGTGFHPELTGRENIFLNGAILGMSRKEIDRKFDEMVAFAEIEKFLDTPVKHYSSGMYVRLAFAVAAHLEPEILLVDEVLAVGDATFQKKCLGKMDDVAKTGRTILFVSHNMRAIQQLCPRSIWISNGQIAADDLSSRVVSAYLTQTASSDSHTEIATIIRNLPADPAIRIESVEILQDGLRTTAPGNGSPIDVCIGYTVSEKTRDLRVFFDVVDSEEIILFRTFHDEDMDDVSIMSPGSYVSRATIPANLLAPGSIDLRIYATIYNVRMCVPLPGIRVPLTVEATGRINRAHPAEPFRGKMAPEINWETRIAS